MFRHTHPVIPLLAALTGLILTACGGGNGTPEKPRVLPENALYHPVTHASGAVERPGETAVLGLTAAASDLPPPFGAPTQGVEDLWFEVTDAQPLPFVLDADTLTAIERVEIRDADNTLLATLSATHPSATLALAPGRYQALVVASAAATAPVAVFARYSAGATANGQMQGAQLPGRVQAQASYTLTVTNTTRPAMNFVFQCVQCNLQGHAMSAWAMSGRDLHGSNLDGANLKGTQFNWAVLYDVNFASANLSGANFQGANLAGANLTGANLTGTDFSNANLSGAIWADGVLRCAPGSIGICK